MHIILFRNMSVFAPRKLHDRLSRVKKGFKNQLLLDYFVWPISDMGCTEHVLPPGQFFFPAKLFTQACGVKNRCLIVNEVL